MIGITERGDPSIDLSWVNNLDKVDGAIIITKGSTGTISEELMRFRHKIILHQTVTGFGDTPIEPKVPNFNFVMNTLYSLVRSGFPADHVVLRIDPILPRYWYGVIGWDRDNLLSNLFEWARTIGIRRIRFSLVDNYSHARERFARVFPNESGYHTSLNFEPTEVQELISIFSAVQNKYQFQIESCAEHLMPQPWKIGCISQKDLNILGVSFNPSPSAMRWQQRPWCRCLPIKKELLTGNMRPCPHGCLYCYWKDQTQGGIQC